MRNTLAILLAHLLAPLAALQAGDAPGRRPNIVVILVDDLGYADLGCQGSTDVESPQIDSIAANGVRCTAGYVTAPQCCPSRAGLITGRYQNRFGFETNNETKQGGLPVGERTIADRLKAAGYVTGLVGKWHLGDGEAKRPCDRGFDEAYWHPHGGVLLPDRQTGFISGMYRGSTRVEEKAYSTDAFGREACAFIERHRAEPFFLYLSFVAPHWPMQAKPEDLARFAHVEDLHRSTMLAMMASLDENVGRVLAALRDAKLEEDTLVFFLSDNGGPTGKPRPRPDAAFQYGQNTSRNDPLRGVKGDLLEGGIRVPFLVQWKGQIPAGTTCPHPVISLDILPTALAAAGVAAAAGWKLDGRNLLPCLTRAAGAAPHDALFWRFRFPPAQPALFRWAIRAGDWKLVKNDGEPLALYDLAADVGETRNLAAAHPDRVAAMTAEWQRWDEENSAAMAAPRSADAPPADRPNVIFILADDLGWKDIGCFGSTYHETPNLDRLASRGVRLTQAYAASPLCSPTRSSILTGQYPARIGITSPACHLRNVQLEKKLGAANPKVRTLTADSLTRLKTDYVTLAETLREAGYATAHFGKWHLGHNLDPDDRYEPRDQGFDVDFPHVPSAAGPGSGYLAPWKFITDAAIIGQPGEHIEDRMSAEAATFIREHKDEPFYLNYWAYSVHGPWNAPGELIEQFKHRADARNPQHNPLYAAMVKSLDDAMGRLLAAVDEAGIADNTIFVLFSDNGGWAFPPKKTDPKGFDTMPATSNLPLRSGKASLYEGGTREPCIVVWPGRVKQGTSDDALLQSVDWYPTLLSMCGLRPPAGLQLDGIDQTPMLLGNGPVRDRLFCHFPHGSRATAADIPGFLPGTSVRCGDWKLIRFYADNEDGSDRFELYNLADDIGESNNVAAERPELVGELNALIDGFLRDTEAVIPIRNRGYDANAVAMHGWVARGCHAAAKDGIVTVTGTTAAPFLGVSVRGNGPAVVRLRVRCAGGGDGKIEWLNGKDAPTPAQSVPLALAGEDWQEVTVNVPANAPFGILRVYLPAQRQPVQVDWIEFEPPHPAKPRRWDF